MARFGSIIATAMAFLLGFSVACAQEAPAGDAAKGRKAYRELACSACHGTTGAGGGWQGPKLTPDLLPWAAFEAQVRTPAARMPPYRAAALSGRDLADVYAYLRTIPKSRPADQINLLKH